MPRKTSSNKDPVADRLDALLTATQNLFILEALRAGVSGDEIRKLLRINNWRISRISKPLKKAMKRTTKK
jgi:hypothetical protein